MKTKKRTVEPANSPLLCATTNNTEKISFNMPACKFCSDCCGNCGYYETVNFSGYCNYHKKYVSAGQTTCSYYF